MKVRVTYNAPQLAVDQVFTGASSEAVVRAMQQTVAAKLNFLMRPVVNAMSPTAFAQEVVKRYNEAARRNVPVPGSCDEFLRLGEQEGIVTVLEA